MDRPLSIASMAFEAEGKTHFGVSLFHSVYFPPERVLYLDNHGSTIAFDVPKYTKSNKFGVRKIDPLDPKGLHDAIMDVRREITAKKKFPYDAIAVDDWSTYAYDEMADRVGDNPGKAMIQHWGEHLSRLNFDLRILHPEVSQAHHLGLFQCAQLPDRKEHQKKEIKDGRVVFSTDNRQLKRQPYLQGAFKDAMPFKFDGIFYQDSKLRGGKLEFNMQIVPQGGDRADVEIKNRWYHNWLLKGAKLPTDIIDPTWDKVYDLFKDLKTEEEKGD